MFHLSLVKCLQCHATFLKSEALELQNTSVVVSYQSAKEYACPFCKSQYHFEREPAVSQGLGPSSLTHSSSPAPKSMGQGQADTKHSGELSEVNPFMPLFMHSVNSTKYAHTYVYMCMHIMYYYYVLLRTYYSYIHVHFMYIIIHVHFLYINIHVHLCTLTYSLLKPYLPSVLCHMSMLGDCVVIQNVVVCIMYNYMYTHQEPRSTEVSDAAEAISPLECTPSLTDEDPTLQMDQEPAGKMEQMKKALPYDTHFMQSNLKVHFECEVFKEDGECLKESLVVRLWCVCGLCATKSSMLQLQVSVLDRSGNTPEAKEVVVFSNRMVYFCGISSEDL